MLHQCAGLNLAVVEWARVAVRRGYVVLLHERMFRFLEAKVE
jgi:hypothetical protein